MEAALSVSDYLRGTRVVVIGAGIVGAVTGYRLAQAGAAVTTVERAFAGAGTSGATFAWLNGFAKQPRDYQRLNMLGIRDHEDLADELEGDWLHVTGTLHWADADDTSNVAEIDATVRRLLRWGTRVDWLTPDEAMRELEPDLWIDPARVDHVAFVPRSGWLDARALAHAAVRAGVERHAASIVRAEVVALPAGAAGMLERVVLADGTSLDADVVVNAAGPDAGWIAAKAGASLPVERNPGLLVVTGPTAARLRRVVYTPDTHLRPDGGGRVMVQWEPLDSDALEGELLPPDHPRVVMAMDRARALLPALADVGPEALRLGIRAMPRDGYPIVGFDPVVPNLYHVVTHSGVTLAARLAGLVTAELTGADSTPLDIYRPARFSRPDQA